MNIVKNDFYLILTPSNNKVLIKKNQPLNYYDELIVPIGTNLNLFVELDKEQKIIIPEPISQDISLIIQDKNLDAAKQALIIKTKENLQNFLKENPLYYKNKFYSVTTTSQAYLDSLIAAAEDAAAINMDFVPYWNDIDGMREPWSLLDLKLLRINIQNYILPYIKQQQQMENIILNAININQLYEISLSYQK